MRHPTTIQLLAAATLTLATSAVAQNYNAPNGNPGDWTQNVPPYAAAPVVNVPAGGPGGSAYTVVPNGPADSYQTGYGNGPYSFFGNNGNPTYRGSFYQSIDVYINAGWAPGSTSPTTAAFWIDMSPDGADNNINYGAEHNFNLTPTGSGVNVTVDDGATVANITTSGWYDFQMLYSKAANPNDPVQTDASVFSLDASGNPQTLLGSDNVLANSPGGPMPSSDLGGNGYVWLTVWQNGFNGDVLDVAAVDTDLVSVPDGASTALLLGGTLTGLAALRRRLS